MRISPAGSLVNDEIQQVALLENVLLIVEPNNKSVKASLEDIEYEWIKVSYFDSKYSLKYEGWVAKEYTEAVPTKKPTKSETYSSNSTLPQAQMLVNARYIFAYLLEAGWSRNPIYALLGNMETESFMNPEYYEEGRPKDKAGFGLVQWTPGKHATPEYYTWVEENQYDKNDIDIQLYRIKLEAEGVFKQWQSYRYQPSMSFESFILSDKSVEELAEIFLYCHERPTIKPQPVRGNQAAKWRDILEILE